MSKLAPSIFSGRETCNAVLNAGSSAIESMGFGSCNLKNVFDYRASTKDIWINCERALYSQVMPLCGFDFSWNSSSATSPPPLQIHPNRLV